MTIALFALLLALLERVPALCFRPARLLRPWLGTDALHLALGYVAGGVLAGLYVGGLSAWLGSRPAWDSAPFGVQVLAALVILDLGNYLVHWWLHSSDTLWAFHAVHHSSRHLDWLATFRSHLVEQLLRRALAPLVLVAAGMPLTAVWIAAAAFHAWAMLNHANVELPLRFLEVVLVTPRLHRLHHVPATTERNLGTVFSFWDRLRGTLVVADTPRAAGLGLPRDAALYPQDWLGQFAEPWRRVVRQPSATAASF